MAYAGNTGVPPTLAEATAIADRIKAGNYAIPAARAAPGAHDVMTTDAALVTIPDPVRQRATDNRINMVGVTMTDVIRSMYTALTIAGETNNYVALIQDMIIACNMAPGVARSRVEEYGQLAPYSMFRSFEINGRVADITTIEGKHGEWVAGSPMHAGSIRMAGLIILANATPGSFLALVGGRMGTLLAPPARPAAVAVVPGVPVVAKVANERLLLLYETIDAMTVAERNWVQTMRPRWAGLINLVEAIYGDAGGDVDRALAAAALYAGYEVIT